MSVPFCPHRVHAEARLAAHIATLAARHDARPMSARETGALDAFLARTGSAVPVLVLEERGVRVAYRFVARDFCERVAHGARPRLALDARVLPWRPDGVGARCAVRETGDGAREYAYRLICYDSHVL